MRPTTARALVLLTAFLMLASCRSSGDFGSEPEQLVDHARVSFQGMMSDNQYPGLVDLATRAKAIMIIPNALRAAFFFGGRGGDGVMLVRGPDGQWSDPAFYTLGGFSWGLQVGGQSSEIVIVIMTDKGVSSIMNREVTLGADAGLAVGEHVKLFRNLVKGDDDSAAAHRKFYDEYLSVRDTPAEFYLQTVERIFQNHDLAKGTFKWHDRLVKPGTIKKTALLTVEGELDDISAPGQTRPAHDLCSALPDDMKKAHLQIGVGHYGIFNGRKWRESVLPVVRDFMRSHA